MDRSDPPSSPPRFDHTDLTRTVRTRISICNRGDGCDGCWLWLGSLDSSGYGKVKMRNRTIIIHRYVWEHFHGPILDDLTIDHLCAVHRNCVNPAHMELVTRTENSIRANERRYGLDRSEFLNPHSSAEWAPNQQPQPDKEES